MVKTIAIYILIGSLIMTSLANNIGQFNGTLAKFTASIDEFRGCVDKYLANVAGDVSDGIGEPLKPVFNIVGEQISRLEKAWDALTAKKSRSDPDDE